MGFIHRMESLNIRFYDNGLTGAMQECHQAEGSSYGVYECHDIPGWPVSCPVLHKNGKITWKKYKGDNYFNDCVASEVGKKERELWKQE